MNYKIIQNILGFLLMIIGGFILTALPFSFYYKSGDHIPIIISAVITSLTGFVIWYFTRQSENKDLGKREGYVIVTLGWVAMSLFGSLPFIISGAIPNYTDAFFETISGFTTTGATILTDIEQMPYGLIYWRSLTQWLGGMGIIVLSLAILPILGIGGMQLFIAEVPGPTKDKIHPRIQETAKRLWGIYAILTVAEILLLMVGGMDVFDSVNHGLTTMATGGFSPKNQSIGYYTSPFIQYVLIIFMFFAGTNFTIHYYALHRNFSFLKTNTEFRFYLFFIIGCTIVITLLHMRYVDFRIEESFRQSLFHVVSLTTTTGYVVSDYENWAPFSRIIFFVLLFIGGCAGSTAGSIKIIRHLLLFKNSFLELKRLMHPNAVIPVRVNERAISPTIILNVQAFFILYLLIFLSGAVVMSLLGLDFVTALGASATCLGNVGPGIGAVGPVANFAHLPELGKWFLTLLMLLGRLELFTVLLLLSSTFWKK
jgi:trk system potassium uptake protein